MILHIIHIIHVIHILMTLDVTYIEIYVILCTYVYINVYTNRHFSVYITDYMAFVGLPRFPAFPRAGN